jgi:hypothetical protein
MFYAREYIFAVAGSYLVPLFEMHQREPSVVLGVERRTSTTY